HSHDRGVYGSGRRVIRAPGPPVQLRVSRTTGTPAELLRSSALYRDLAGFWDREEPEEEPEAPEGLKTGHGKGQGKEQGMGRGIRSTPPPSPV
ncbi:hypothetical protein ABZ679_36635, partial [Streptomyces fimicarius]